MTNTFHNACRMRFAQCEGKRGKPQTLLDEILKRIDAVKGKKDTQQGIS